MIGRWMGFKSVRSAEGMGSRQERGLCSVGDRSSVSSAYLEAMLVFPRKVPSLILPRRWNDYLNRTGVS